MYIIYDMFALSQTFIKILAAVLIVLTRGCYGDLVCCCEAVEGRTIAVLHNWVDRVCLLQLEYQLLHGLHGVAPAQIDNHLLDLNKCSISETNWKNQ